MANGGLESSEALGFSNGFLHHYGIGDGLVSIVSTGSSMSSCDTVDGFPRTTRATLYIRQIMTSFWAQRTGPTLLRGAGVSEPRGSQIGGYALLGLMILGKSTAARGLSTPQFVGFTVHKLGSCICRLYNLFTFSWSIGERHSRTNPLCDAEQGGREREREKKKKSRIVQRLIVNQMA